MQHYQNKVFKWGLGPITITREELEKTYMQYAQQTEDLRLIPEYKQLLTLCNLYSLRVSKFIK